jgi:hypothetical protein
MAGVCGGLRCTNRTMEAVRPHCGFRSAVVELDSSSLRESEYRIREILMILQHNLVRVELRQCSVHQTEMVRTRLQHRSGTGEVIGTEFGRRPRSEQAVWASRLSNVVASAISRGDGCVGGVGPVVDVALVGEWPDEFGAAGEPDVEWIGCESKKPVSCAPVGRHGGGEVGRDEVTRDQLMQRARRGRTVRRHVRWRATVSTRCGRRAEWR